jgi:chemotaxis protein methyltransferase CheR
VNGRLARPLVSPTTAPAPHVPDIDALIPAQPTATGLAQSERAVVEISRPDQPTVPSPTILPSEPAPDAGVCYAARQYVRAAELAAAVVRHRPGDTPHWVLLVRALANDGRLTDAGRACARAIELHPTCVELAYLHAILLSAADHHAEAAAAARRALYLDRHFIVAHLALGTALVKTGDRAGARRAFRNAEQLLRDQPTGEPIGGSDGELAGRLASLARSQLQLLGR